LLNVLYNLFLHPLRRYPGPFLWKATRLTYMRRMVSGSLPCDIAALHVRYGPVVRVAPNELAFAHTRAWKEIVSGGRDELPKWASVMRAMDLTPANIQNTVDKSEHTMLRRCMAPGFSAQSLRSQEALITKYVDLLMIRLREICEEGQAKLDVMSWMNFASFDIIGDLAFGESFGCLAESRYHPWIQAIQTGGMAICFMAALGMIPALKWLANTATRGLLKKKFAPHAIFSQNLVRKRAALGLGRPDLIGSLLEKQRDGVRSQWKVRPAWRNILLTRIGFRS
jgi:cytochrome P450